MGEIAIGVGTGRDGNNYFMLRDIARFLRGTPKQFEVEWDQEKRAVNLISGKPYTSIGVEGYMILGDEIKTAIRSDAKIYLDGREIDLTAYTVDGYSYFKLRDLAAALDFHVGWNETDGVIEIDPMFGYTPEKTDDGYAFRTNVNVRDTQQKYVFPYAQVSSVQQFSYKNEGLAYAYVQDQNLVIVTPRKQLSLEMKYPRLGDVIADEDGNFYVIWGRKNERSDEIIETVFVSKYSPEGEHIRTIGFVGAATPWGDRDSVKTQLPFAYGNSVSAIANGILVNYYARVAYSGHQSDNVIAVNISDLSPYELPNNAYTSHSFNQSVIYSKHMSGFLFASQGDASPRGFRVNGANGSFGDQNDVTFHFYLESNANYDMSIINWTFAQLGGLAETGQGVALVGASAKSIGEEAKTEKQNLFVQIFDPRAPKRSPSAYIGGTVRSGATSFNINDNQNSPLTPVTDHGVIWLTDHTDRNVITPQVAAADDRIVILWSEVVEGETNYESFYTVLSAEGKVITPATSLGNMPLNSYEMPIWHDGKIWWAYALNGKIAVTSITP